jgi:hypothetical protein
MTQDLEGEFCRPAMGVTTTVGLTAAYVSGFLQVKQQVRPTNRQRANQHVDQMMRNGTTRILCGVGNSDALCRSRIEPQLVLAVHRRHQRMMPDVVRGQYSELRGAESCEGASDAHHVQVLLRYLSVREAAAPQRDFDGLPSDHTHGKAARQRMPATRQQS